MSHGPVYLGQKLTPRELEVLAGAAHGRSNREIGQRLGLAADTVSTYIARILIKLGARTRAHAVTIAFVRGVLQLPKDEVDPC